MISSSSSVDDGHVGSAPTMVGRRARRTESAAKKIHRLPKATGVFNVDIISLLVRSRLVAYPKFPATGEQVPSCDDKDNSKNDGMKRPYHTKAIFETSVFAA